MGVSDIFYVNSRNYVYLHSFSTLNGFKEFILLLLSDVIYFSKKRITENQSNLKELAPLQFEVPTLLIRVTMAGCGGPPKGSQQYALYDFGHWAVLLASNGLSHLVALALAFTVFFICIVVS